MRGWSIQGVLLAGVFSTMAGACTASQQSAPAGAAAAPSAPAPATSAPSLLIPVQGVTAAQLSDTFGDARAQGRAHDAIDIMAARGTAVLAVADGHIEKLFTSKPGGLTIYQLEPSGRYAYYYAHLDRYADGLAEKQTVRRGQVIGFVGSTGNANPEAPHLHFSIFELGPERQWWKGTAINPYPVLRQAR
jgi:peptidoglycan LD-endopeptidase LytH